MWKRPTPSFSMVTRAGNTVSGRFVIIRADLQPRGHHVDHRLDCIRTAHRGGGEISDSGAGPWRVDPHDLVGHRGRPARRVHRAWIRMVSRRRSCGFSHGPLGGHFDPHNPQASSRAFQDLIRRRREVGVHIGLSGTWGCVTCREPNPGPHNRKVS